MAGRFIMEGVPTSHNPELHITFSSFIADRQSVRFAEHAAVADGLCGEF